MADRPHVPNSLQRAVKVEAGHRCAIPTCRHHPVELAHIEPRKQDGSNNVFENLIALCPTCHSRYDRGEIDRTAMRIYKANLGVLTGRYCDIERRLLDSFAANPGVTAIQVPRDMDFEFMYLLRDGLLAKTQNRTGVWAGTVQIAGVCQYALTDQGREFLSRWSHGQSIEDE